MKGASSLIKLKIKVDVKLLPANIVNTDCCCPRRGVLKFSSNDDFFFGRGRKTNASF